MSVLIHVLSPSGCRLLGNSGFLSPVASASLALSSAAVCSCPLFLWVALFKVWAWCYGWWTGISLTCAPLGGLDRCPWP